jgi:WD40 repeat protein
MTLRCWPQHKIHRSSGTEEWSQSMKFTRVLFRAKLWQLLAVLILSSSGIVAEEWTSQLVRLEPKPGKEHSPVITALAIDPTGRFAALGGDDHLVRIWDLLENRIARTLDAHADWVRTLTFSPNGEMLVTSGNDRRVIVWNAATGEKLREYSELSHVVTSVVFSHDGKLVGVVGFGDKLRIIDGLTGDRLREYSCPTSDMRTVAFSLDDSLIVGGGRNGMIRLWNSRDGAVLGEFSAHSQRIRDLSFSPDGTLLATCGEDRKVVISRVTGEQVVELPRHGAKVMTLVFCGPDQLATGGSDNRIHIWDLNTREKSAELAGHTGTISVLAYAQDVLVSSGYDTTFRIWKRKTSYVSEERRATTPTGLLPTGR